MGLRRLQRRTAGRRDSELICEQFLESLAGLVFTRGILGRTHILAPDKLEVFAVIGEVLFRDGICASIPALLGQTRSVTDAIHADLQIRATRMTSLGTTGRTG